MDTCWWCVDGQVCVPKLEGSVEMREELIERDPEVYL